jgi:8-oxo-dGTP pyrophosphatase MutT (NUDIX family)
VFGAAGLLLAHRAADGARWLLMQHRASWSHHGGTWGLLGGARAPEETAEQAAAREAWEEASLAAGSYRVAGNFVDDHGGWSYVTVLAMADSLLEVGSLNAESTEVRWVREGELAGLDLHPGFAATWPEVSALVP